LGDDIVIRDAAVAKEYRRIIEVVLGCKISTAKSLISQDSFEFAKRFWVDGVEVSHIPWPQLFAVQDPLNV
jgi:hypothetical protein